MLLSLGTYVAPTTTPDGDAVYGSLHDYFNKMSSGNVVITGRVVNNLGPGKLPIWVTMGPSQTKAYYYSQTGCTFADQATAFAASQGLDVSTSNANDRLVIIYAGNTYFLRPDGVASSLNPRQCFRTYIMSERQGTPYNQENTTDKFSRIGLHCHEFAHTLGIGHTSGSRANVMQAGYRNGPDNRGAAPAPINPVWRAVKGWLTPTPITGQQQFDTYYSLVASQTFRINSNNNDYFIIENRRFNQQMIIGSASIPDYNNAEFFPPAWPHGTITQGLFVWRVRGGTPIDYGDNGLIYASGRYGQTWPEGIPSETDDGVPFPGNRNVRVWSPWSDARNPSPNLPPNSGLFVPNSRYGTNVGMEVLSENQAQGYFTVVLYQQTPEDASPSMPQNVLGSIYIDQYTYRHPRLNWTAMQEPDVISGGNILVHRRTKIQSPTWTTWSLFATLPGTSTEYIDMSIGTAGLGTTDSVQYRIQAKDNTTKLSVYSDIVSMTVGTDFWKIANADGGKPETFGLAQNYPNPFNPMTVVSYSLPEDVHVSLKVFDLLGREVLTLANQDQKAGRYEMRLDASTLASGIYFYRLQAGAFIDIKRMLLLK